MRGLRDVITGCKERGWMLTVHDDESAIQITTPTQEYGVIGIGSRHETRIVKTIRYDKVVDAWDDGFDERFLNALIDFYDLVCYEEDRINGNT